MVESVGGCWLGTDARFRPEMGLLGRWMRGTVQSHESMEGAERGGSVDVGGRIKGTFWNAQDTAAGRELYAISTSSPGRAAVKVSTVANAFCDPRNRDEA